MQQGLASWQAAGQLLSQIYFHALLAEGYGLAGDTTAGLATVAAGQAIAEQCADQFYRAELYRLQGDLLLAHGEAPDKGESAYRQAIELARQRREKSTELRAATSLARLWQQQGRAAEAHQLLADVYHWFTEGFNTVDLQTAKALLLELQAAR
jgi:adenylate cyclase